MKQTDFRSCLAHRQSIFLRSLRFSPEKRVPQELAYIGSHRSGYQPPLVLIGIRRIMAAFKSVARAYGLKHLFHFWWRLSVTTQHVPLPAISKTCNDVSEIGN
jgi:hypothetical protein